MSLESLETEYQIYFLDVILIVHYLCRHCRPTRHISFPGYCPPADLTACIWSIVDKKIAPTQSIILVSPPPPIITPHKISSSHYHDIYGLDITYYFIYTDLFIPPMVLPLSLLISRHIGFKEHVLVKHKTLSGHIEKPLYYTGFI